MGDACLEINKAFSQLLEIRSNLIKVENNPRLVSIVDPEGEVIVGTLLVKAGQYSGHIHLVFPFATLEPLRDLLKELLNISSKTKSNWHEIIEEQLQDMPITLIAQSGTIEMNIRKVLNLQVGDVIGLDYDPNSPIQVLVENSPKYYAISGTHNGKKAISLKGIY
jgi:flagellar motor switch protein FliM